MKEPEKTLVFRTTYFADLGEVISIREGYRDRFTLFTNRLNHPDEYYILDKDSKVFYLIHDLN